MARKVVAVACTLLFCGVAMATTSDVYGFTMMDIFYAWPATERFSDGALDRVLSMPDAIAARAAARRDIANGRLRVKMWGCGFSARRIYSRMLAERGIDSEVVGGAIKSHREAAGWTGYDDVMFEEIEARFGERFLRDTVHAAEAEYERHRYVSHPHI